MPSRVPAQAQDSCFMCALDLSLEDAHECKGPTLIGKAAPACMSCQYIDKHKLS